MLQLKRERQQVRLSGGLKSKIFTMTTRRSFIKSTSLLSAGIFLSPKVFRHKRSLIGLQLYTVRDAMLKDAADTLSKVAKIGYNTVEGATYTGTQRFYNMD